MVQLFHLAPEEANHIKLFSVKRKMTKSIQEFVRTIFIIELDSQNVTDGCTTESNSCT